MFQEKKMIEHLIIGVEFTYWSKIRFNVKMKICGTATNFIKATLTPENNVFTSLFVIRRIKQAFIRCQTVQSYHSYMLTTDLTHTANRAVNYMNLG